MTNASRAYVLAALLLGGCAANTASAPHDPFEPVNRAVHSFNKGVDTAVLRPAASVYDAVTPDLIQHLLGNGLDYLATPAYFANFLLQGDGSKALETVGRFGVNTVFGAGVLDPATDFGLPRQPTDFGLTMQSWGVKPGAYVELPLLGPSTTRDALGRVVNMALNPTTYLGLSGSERLQLTGDITRFTQPMAAVQFRADNMDLVNSSLYDAPDSYALVRGAYLQQRSPAKDDDAALIDSIPDIYSPEFYE